MQIMLNANSYYQTHLSPAEQMAAEEEDIKKLGKIVEGAFESVAKLTRLSVQEVLHIIEEVDVAQLSHAFRGAIKKIVDATDLHRDHIVAIFTANKDARLDELVHRLREESRVHRGRW
jgi:metal-dependent HD superfamily phosphatase/phosphodiesterase